MLIKLHRLLWLYCGVHDFAGLHARGAASGWPVSWRPALGKIAANTPVLIVGR